MSYRSIKCNQTSCGNNFLVYEYLATSSVNDEAGIITCPYCHQTELGELGMKYVAAGLEKPFSVSEIADYMH